MRKFRRIAPLVVALLLCWAAPASAATWTATATGESFISGEGGTESGPYLVGSDTPTNQCHRSRTSPAALAAAMRQFQLDDLSCSGATTADLLTTSRYSEPPQIGRIKPDTRLVLVMIGGNDMGFGTLFGCFLQTDCDQTTVPADSLDKIDQLEPKLDKTYDSIRTQAPGARVVVQLYAPLLPPFKTPYSKCDWLNQGELGLGNVIQRKLNSVITRQALAHGFRVADPSKLFRGHSLCDGDESWFYTPGTVPPPATAHPNLMGRAVMASEFARLSR